MLVVFLKIQIDGRIQNRIGKIKGQKYQQEKDLVLFWNDSEGEFEDSLEELALDGVQVIRPDKIGHDRDRDDGGRDYCRHTGNFVKRFPTHIGVFINKFQVQFFL